MTSPFKTLSTRVAWSCPWYAVRQDEITLPNGQRGEYNVIEKTDAVWIVPVTSAGEIVLVYHYRYTVDDWCWEIPAGGIHPGQSPQEAAVAELREEIGGTAVTLTPLGRFYTANGICNEAGHFFLAQGVTLGRPHHEPAEVMEIHPTPAAEALRMARAGEISDAPSVLALLLCAPLLPAQ